MIAVKGQVLQLTELLSYLYNCFDIFFKKVSFISASRFWKYVNTSYPENWKYPNVFPEKSSTLIDQLYCQKFRGFEIFLPRNLDRTLNRDI